ncbi:MAG TPA: SPW repeat protein [Pseudolabrys sp.]|nr:SPW repeat protein [Pseudolabrys sp.]
MSRREAILDIYKMVLGAFLFVSPWLFAFAHGVVAADAWFSSAIIVIVSLATLVGFAEWEEWLAFLLGVWLVVSPWVLGFQHTSAMVVNLSIGIIVMYLAALELWVIHFLPPDTPHHADKT